MSHNTHVSGNRAAAPSMANTAYGDTMKNLNEEAKKLKADRLARDARRTAAAQRVQDVAQRAFRPAFALPGVRADLFQRYCNPNQPAETAPACSDTVLARFDPSNPRLWATHDGKLSPEDVEDVRAWRIPPETLAPGNAYALSPAGWRQLGYLCLEMFDKLYAHFLQVRVSDTEKNRECCARAIPTLAGAENAFNTADRLEYAITHLGA